ncbi:MAG: FAD-dependent oxidoreductase [Verrucomicrobia bacterium]|nr:FAD-dependent oxidoreductase [Verrucomicrobiota bacterium]
MVYTRASILMRRDFIVIGGGIVGLATALRILEAKPGTKMLLLEKESSLGRHQTGHNSGVLHAGLYYKPGSLKAKLAVEGLRQMVDFCQRHGVAHEVCGKIVVATEPRELPRLEKLLERGSANGLQGLRKLSPDQIREIEPHAAGLAAIHVPEEGIVDYAGVVEAMAREIQRLGGEIRTGNSVKRLKGTGGVWRVETEQGGFEARQIVVVLAMAREGYTWGNIHIGDLTESLAFPGLWKFMLKYPSICSYEIWRSVSRNEFCRSLQKLVPEICEQDLEAGSAGVRAQAMSSDGSLVEDFSFVEEPGILHVVNAPSPAATASLAIGEYVARRLDLKSAK